MIKVLGKNNISAKVIADSINEKGIRMTTFELNFHRYILAESNTHRMLSKNAASSRAIPLQSIIQQIMKEPAVPVHWGTNNPGMQSKAEMSVEDQELAKAKWFEAMHKMIESADELGDKDGLNMHKQNVNRLLEPFTMTKQVLTGTTFANLLNLRDHDDAQPEFKVLASCIKDCLDKSVPQLLVPGEWHVPYVTTKRNSIGNLEYWSNDVKLDIETARKISASCCAQVSYRKLDDSIKKALEIFDMLHLEDDQHRQKHASPVEHQGTPIDTFNIPFNPNSWEPGVTHVRRDGTLWSGNLQGWIQYRQLIANEAVW